ncbi:MAG: Fic family protein, partial [Pseudomonadota bacterium]
MNKLLAEDLKKARRLAQENIIDSTKLPNASFRRLKKLGWLAEIIRGWYILKTPEAAEGESTLWYANFWPFLKVYLQKNYKDDYCLNPTSSLFLKTDCNVVPKQVVVILKTGGTRTLDLPFNTSIFFYVEKTNFPTEVEDHHGINTIELAKALTLVPESFFSSYETEAELALCMVRSPADLSKHLLNDSKPAKADILAGAYEFLKKDDFVNQIKQDMELLPHTVRPKNPFIKKVPSFTSFKVTSPAVARIEMLWKKHRDFLISHFPGPKGKKQNIKEILAEVDKIYVHDAYNSLSIEGYAVTEELIQKVAEGNFDPEINEEDKKQEGALAARGYYLAFTAVKKFIKDNFGKTQNTIKYQNIVQTTYQKLFTPKVQAGVANPSLLVGYRNRPVFIRGSRHTPVNFSIVGDVMDKFFELLDAETSPKAQAILGHFILVYIHPFSDGNGRTARLLMNLILMRAGYPPAVILTVDRKKYYRVLKDADKDRFEGFLAFIGRSIDRSLSIYLNA